MSLPQDERFMCSTGMKKYLFVSTLWPHEFLIFTCQTFMEEILQLHIFADNALVCTKRCLVTFGTEDFVKL